MILLGAVQLTMFSVGFNSGERFGAIAWVGPGLATAGLAYLVSPGVTATPLSGAVLFLSEAITPRLDACSAAILGGIALMLIDRSTNPRTWLLR